ncbi:hypothetical protein BB561_005820 [Smittium simulii]|uniref:Uncharacterized protein n=1 Tax=Smittium simulii TaxID=133385 RepID=A0A2T9Y841_9FUNG|nr:hypothetical protein BB561_005820 [Smittium simulii]
MKPTPKKEESKFFSERQGAALPIKQFTLSRWEDHADAPHTFVSHYKSLPIQDNSYQSSKSSNVERTSSIHQNTETRYNMGQITRNKDGRIFGQPFDFGRAQRNMYEKYRAGIYEANRVSE